MIQIRNTPREPVFGKGPDDSGAELAEVVEVQGDLLKVKPYDNPICKSCGSSSVCFPSEGNRPILEVSNRVGAQVGDIVALKQGEGPKIGASLIVFGLPVASTVGGTVLGMSSAADPSGGAAAGAIAGLALGMLLLNMINRIVGAGRAFKPEAREIVGHVGAHSPA